MLNAAVALPTTFVQVEKTSLEGLERVTVRLYAREWSALEASIDGPVSKVLPGLAMAGLSYLKACNKALFVAGGKRTLLPEAPEGISVLGSATARDKTAIRKNIFLSGANHQRIIDCGLPISESLYHLAMFFTELSDPGKYSHLPPNIKKHTQSV